MYIFIHSSVGARHRHTVAVPHPNNNIHAKKNITASINVGISVPIELQRARTRPLPGPAHLSALGRPIPSCLCGGTGGVPPRNRDPMCCCSRRDLSNETFSSSKSQFNEISLRNPLWPPKCDKYRANSEPTWAITHSTQQQRYGWIPLTTGVMRNQKLHS